MRMPSWPRGNSLVVVSRARAAEPQFSVQAACAANIGPDGPGYTPLALALSNRCGHLHSCRYSDRAGSVAILGRGRGMDETPAAESAAPDQVEPGQPQARQTAGISFSVIVVTIVLIELMAFVLATISKPWVPAELVTLSSPIVANPVHPTVSLTSKPVVFIVDEANDRVTMLMDEDRYLVSVPESAIKQRMICHLSDQFSGAAPLIETIFGQTYQPHDLACWRNTDQPLEQAKQGPPMWIRIVQWDS